MPIYAEESVLDKAGIFLDKETGKPVTEKGAGGVEDKRREVTEEEKKKLFACCRFFFNKIYKCN